MPIDGNPTSAWSTASTSTNGCATVLQRRVPSAAPAPTRASMRDGYGTPIVTYKDKEGTPGIGQRTHA